MIKLQIFWSIITQKYDKTYRMGIKSEKRLILGVCNKKKKDFEVMLSSAGQKLPQNMSKPKHS